MTNPPPDPGSSRLGFDELVAIVVAFAVIGIILLVSLRQKGGGFNLDSFLPATTIPQASPDIFGSPTPDDDNVLEDDEAIARDPVYPAPQVTPESNTQVVPLAPVPPVVTVPVPATTEPTPTPTVRFTDVPQDYWALPFIAALTDRGVIAGFNDGTFRPDAPVTRAEFAAQLNQAFGEETAATPGAALVYSDVLGDFWAAGPIRAMTQSGFLRGYPGNVFQPQQEIPKLQALLALNSGLNLEQAANPEQVLQTYEDAQEIPDYATDAIAAATEAGLVVNYPNRQSLNPDELTTRAEAAALLYQALVQSGEAEAIASEYVVQP